jgi:post-segregation antitoxin (ccd killing protein)
MPSMKTQSRRASRRATVYLDRDLHKALRIKSVQTEKSVSELINQAVKQSLTEDAEDLAAFNERAAEPDLSFEDVLKDLRRRGKL